MLVVGTGDSSPGNIQLWNLKSGEQVGQPVSTPGGVLHTSISPDGKTLLAACENRIAYILSITNLGLVQTGKTCSHEAEITSANFDSTGRRVVTSSRDRSARVWDVQTGLPLTVSLQHGNPVLSAAFSSDGKQVITVAQSESLRVWEAETGLSVFPTWKGTQQGGVAYSPPDRSMTTLGYDGGLATWKLDPRLSVSDYTELAECYGARRLDKSGTFLSLTADEHFAKWLVSVAKYPEQFQVPFAQVVRWRFTQIKDSIRFKNLAAAWFHQKWLLTEAINQSRNSTTESK